MPKEKAARNKTIDTPVAEGRQYIARCIVVEEQIHDIQKIIDKTIIGDTFLVLEKLPQDSVDLIIADPPYNLTKTFSGTKFSRRKDTDYEEYTRRWLSLVRPLLRPNGSIYICCDWETSLIIGRVLTDFF